MANLRGLIRLRRHDLDSLRKEMASLNTRIGSLERQIRHIDNNLIEEKEIAETLPDGAQRYGIYAEGMKIRKTGLFEILSGLNQQREELQDKVTAAFMDLKAVEITQERRALEAAEAEKKAETQAFDEIAIERYRRRAKKETQEN